MTTFNPYWQQATWVIDPANSTGLASDGNTGLDATHPLLTFAELAARWGTYSPRIRQNTTITFLSSQPDNTDPVILTPFLEGASMVLQGTLGAGQQIATGVLASTTAKNRATPQLLQTNSGATATNQLVVNTTHASRAWTSINVGGGVFAMSQPLAPITVPGLFSATSVDTWANGDSVTVYQPVTIHPLLIAPQVAIDAGEDNLSLFVYQLKLAPLFVAGKFNVNTQVAFIECAVQVTTQLDAVGRAGFISGQANAIFTDFNGGPPAANIPMAGGRWDFGRMCCPELTNDIIVGIGAGGNGIDLGGPQLTFLAAVYVANGATLNCSQSCRGDTTLGGSTLIVWGPGTLNLRGRARLLYPAGAGGATAAFLMTGGFALNSVPQAYSLTGAVWAGGITVNAANLDAASGASGFGGQAINPNGATVSNTGA